MDQWRVKLYYSQNRPKVSIGWSIYVLSSNTIIIYYILIKEILE